MTILKMVELTLEELKIADPLAIASNKRTLLNRLKVIKNALIIGDLEKDYSEEEIINFQQ